MAATCNPEQLEQRLSEPDARVVDAMSRLSGDLVVLGAGGKMGPSLTTMARRASDQAGVQRRVIAVSRFQNAEARDALEAAGVEIIAGDLLDPSFIRSLPECENVLFMVGMKFGTSDAQSTTWATNTYLPGVVCEKFRDGRIGAFSTGNVYGLVPCKDGNASKESDTLRPVGEYAMSAMGRERIFDYFSRKLGIPTVILRLNYATEMRYGVLVDLATKVFHEEPISLAMGYFNAIWQTDACRMTLCCMEHASSPPLVLNLTGLELAATRHVCEKFGEIMNKDVSFVDVESESALLSDARKAAELLGEPQAGLDELIQWTADWLMRGGDTWNKPTHFEVRDGVF